MDQGRHDPDELAQIENARRLMQKDLESVHIRGQLTNYFGESSGAFLVATAAYALGNLAEAVKGSKAFSGHGVTLLNQALDSVKALHFAMRVVEAPETGDAGKQWHDVQERGSLPGDPPKRG